MLFEPRILQSKATDMVFRASKVTINKTNEFNNLETIKDSVEITLGLAVVSYLSIVNEERNNLR